VLRRLLVAAVLVLVLALVPVLIARLLVLVAVTAVTALVLATPRRRCITLFDCSSNSVSGAASC
jgi:hypothetical protein